MAHRKNTDHAKPKPIARMDNPFGKLADVEPRKVFRTAMIKTIGIIAKTKLTIFIGMVHFDEIVLFIGFEKCGNLDKIGRGKQH